MGLETQIEQEGIVGFGQEYSTTEREEEKKPLSERETVVSIKSADKQVEATAETTEEATEAAKEEEEASERRVAMLVAETAEIRNLQAKMETLEEMWKGNRGPGEPAEIPLATDRDIIETIERKNFVGPSHPAYPALANPEVHRIDGKWQGFYIREEREHLQPIHQAARERFSMRRTYEQTKGISIEPGIMGIPSKEVRAYAKENGITAKEAEKQIRNARAYTKGQNIVDAYNKAYRVVNGLATSQARQAHRMEETKIGREKREEKLREQRAIERQERREKAEKEWNAMTPEEQHEAELKEALNVAVATEKVDTIELKMDIQKYLRLVEELDQRMEAMGVTSYKQYQEALEGKWAAPEESDEK